MSIPSGQAPISDIELINRVKAQQDSAAISELVHRHTGIYIDIINQYEAKSSYFRARANVNDLKDDRFINIYKFALKYDPSHPTTTGKPMQFGSYVGEMTKFICKSALTEGRESLELNEEIVADTDDSVTDIAERDDAIENIRHQVDSIDDGILDQIAKKQAQVDVLLSEITQMEDELIDKKAFKEIFNMRYGAANKKPLPWRTISEKMNMSHEGVRKAFMRHMEIIKERATR